MELQCQVVDTFIVNNRKMPIFNDNLLSKYCFLIVNRRCLSRQIVEKGQTLLSIING